MTTTARYDGVTGDYVIFSSDGIDELLTGNGSIDEFHRMSEAIRKAEKRAMGRALDVLAVAMGDAITMEHNRARQALGL